jgi:O-succinylbenzoate synthase
MRITDARLFNFALPLKRPLKIGGSTLEVRHGLLLRLEDDAGNIGWGETSPLTEWYSGISLAEGEQQLRFLCNWLIGRDVPAEIVRLDGSLAAWFKPPRPAPSVMFGIETALINLICAAENKPPARLMTPQPSESVLVNGLILDDVDVTQAARTFKRLGYRAIKLKVGRQAIQTDVRRTQDVYHELGDSVPLRLDANRLWTFEQALEFASGISDCRLEYIEEPVNDHSRARQFAGRSGLPVALDESLIELKPGELDYHPYLSALILKPTLLGGLERTAKLARMARSQKIKVVISSCFESSVGIASLIQLAAAFESFNTPAGLDTVDWFEHDLLTEPLNITNGRTGMAGAWRALQTIDLSRLTEATGD